MGVNTLKQFGHSKVVDAPEVDWDGRPIEREPCCQCGRSTPLSVNSVGPDGISCFQCRMAARQARPVRAVLPPPVWALEELIGPGPTTA